VIMFNPELVSGGITQTKKLSAEAVENLLDAPVEDYGSGTGTNDNW